MRQTGDLRVKLESCGALLLCHLELPLLELADVRDANLCAEVAKHLVLGFVDDGLQGVDALLQCIVRGLGLVKGSDE